MHLCDVCDANALILTSFSFPAIPAFVDQRLQTPISPGLWSCVRRIENAIIVKVKSMILMIIYVQK